MATLHTQIKNSCVHFIVLFSNYVQCEVHSKDQLIVTKVSYHTTKQIKVGKKGKQKEELTGGIHPAEKTQESFVSQTKIAEAL